MPRAKRTSRGEPSRASRYRQKQVMLAMLAEEHRVLRLSNGELRQRMREIYEACAEPEESEP